MIETDLGNLIRTNAAQQRASMTWDPVLHAVARARAMSMATRRYFDHVDPDGYGPNRLVQLAGYALPVLWGVEPDGNFIESIGAGSSTASGAFTNWMNSPTHRAHLMAEDQLHLDQIRYAVAFVDVPGSQMRRYQVFISAPEPQGGAVALTPYTEWLLTRFTPLQLDEGNDETDDSGDGLGRIVKFALGMNPSARNQLPDPVMNRTAQRMEWTLPLIADLGNVQARVECSANLTSWTTNGVERTGNQFRLSTGPGAGCGFLRLQVTR